MLPRVETIAETYPGFDAATWHALVAPAGTPKEAIAALNKATVQALQDPVVRKALTDSGVGAMRTASYANGIRVLEPVDEWQPYNRYGFGVMLDPATLLPSPIWQAVESKHFDVTHVAYTLEPRPEGTREGTLVRLETEYQLSSPVNSYAAVWLNFMLGDFESYILDIVKHRAETR